MAPLNHAAHHRTLRFDNPRLLARDQGQRIAQLLRGPVITSISFDHTQQLGNTLALIAGEKAGIIKPGVPVVSGVIEPEPREVIRRIAAEPAVGGRLLERGTDFDFTYELLRHLERDDARGALDWRKVGQDRVATAGPPTSASLSPPTRENGGPALAEARWSHPTTVSLSLPGRHQAANAATALAALDVLRAAGWQIPQSAVETAAGRYDTWPGKGRRSARRPAVVLDAAHNVASIEALMETLRESFSVARRLLIFGTTQDKDVQGMLACLLEKGVRTVNRKNSSDPFFFDVFFTRYQGSSRAVPPEELQRLADELTGKPLAGL